MKRHSEKDLSFLRSLDEADTKRFYNMTPEEKRRTITENQWARQDETLWENDLGVSQLCDRKASKNFQG